MSQITASALIHILNHAHPASPVRVILAGRPKATEPVTSADVEFVPEVRVNLTIADAPVEVHDTAPDRDFSVVQRSITLHRIEGNPLNNVIAIDVLDEPGAGNMNHDYLVSVLRGPGESPVETRIRFQKGPLGEVGPNGLSNESLLAIVIDRLEGAQAGPFKCDDNEDALTFIRAGMTCLHARTLRRLKQGVEGKNLNHVESDPTLTGGTPVEPASITPPPPVDNAHVAPGCEPFANPTAATANSGETIAAKPPETTTSNTSAQ